MTVRDILKMGDPRLLRTAQPVTAFDTDALHLLITDMLDTMRAANGAGLAAPQIGVDLQVVIFGTDAANPRYPDAPIVPRTVLINPVITTVIRTDFNTQNKSVAPVDIAQAATNNIAKAIVAAELEDGWEGCLSVPGLRGVVPRYLHIRYSGFDQFGDPIERTVSGFHARVVQHECDHLQGILYPMRIKDFTRFGFTEVLFPGLDAADD